MKRPQIAVALTLCALAFVGILAHTPALVAQAPTQNTGGAGLGANTYSGNQTICASCWFNFTGGSFVATTAAGVLRIVNSTGLQEYAVNPNPASLGTGWGTSPSIKGDAQGGSINVGTGGTATSGTITFSTDGRANHFCMVEDQTHPAQATTTSCSMVDGTLTISTTSAWAASDVITWQTFATN